MRLCGRATPPSPRSAWWSGFGERGRYRLIGPADASGWPTAALCTAGSPDQKPTN
jgi:hypothetical protein